MPLYEHVFMARPDLSPQQVEELTAKLTGVITEGGGKVTKSEYWGLKSLSYRIRKNRKAHYSLLNIDAPAPAVAGGYHHGHRAASAADIGRARLAGRPQLGPGSS